VLVQTVGVLIVVVVIEVVVVIAVVAGKNCPKKI
jgi:hypothetical protein